MVLSRMRAQPAPAARKTARREPAQPRWQSRPSSPRRQSIVCKAQLQGPALAKRCALGAKRRDLAAWLSPASGALCTQHLIFAQPRNSAGRPAQRAAVLGAEMRSPRLAVCCCLFRGFSEQILSGAFFVVCGHEVSAWFA